MEYLTGITFGHVTLACLTLTIVALVLAGAEKLGVLMVKLMLNADHPDAPKFDWELKVWGVLKSTPLVRKPVQDKKTGKWSCPTGFGIIGRFFGHSHLSSDLKNSWSREFIFFSACYHATKQGAQHTYDNSNSVHLPINLNFVIGIPLLIDLSIYLLQLAFIPTLTLLGVVTLVWGTRKIAGVVYSNSKGIKGHEERITKLEE